MSEKHISLNRNGYENSVEYRHRIGSGYLVVEEALGGQDPKDVFPGEPNASFGAPDAQYIDKPHSIVEGPTSYIALVGIAAHYDRPNIVEPDTPPIDILTGESHMSPDMIGIITGHAREIAKERGEGTMEILCKLRDDAFGEDLTGDPRYPSPDLEFLEFGHRIGFFGNGGNFDAPRFEPVSIDPTN